MQNSDKLVWLQFFKDASIPTEFVALYANKFIENRIRFDMLADLDRPLLNELGITAIGDCLSILKHAKLIQQKIEESKKEIVKSSNDIKNGDVAKRIIQNYLNESDQIKSPTASKIISLKSSATATNSGGSTISADLLSRVNFNPSTSPSFPKISVTFGGGDDSSFNSSSNNKVIVSSTTDDESSSALNRSIKSKNKRSIEDDTDVNTKKLNKTVVVDTRKEPQLPYKGILKKSISSSIISLKSANSNLNKSLNSSSPRIKITNEHLSVDESLSSRIQGKINANLENIRIQANNDSSEIKKITFSNEKPAVKESVFSRLGNSSTNKNNSKTVTSKPDSTSGMVIKKINDQLSTINVTKRILNDCVITKTTEKPKITPITCSPNDFKTKSEVNKTVKQQQQQQQKESIKSHVLSRISFK